MLDRPCDECGFDASAYDRPAIPRAFRKNAQVWFALLADPAAAERSRPDRWSTLEYACHVHDVHQIYHDRVTQMLAEDDPLFDNWDQDSAAVRGSVRRPAAVDHRADAGRRGVRDRRPLRLGAAAVLAPARAAQRRAASSPIETLARYQLHDVVHHLHDVRGRRAARRPSGRTTRPPPTTATGTRELPATVAAAIGRFAGSWCRRAAGCWRSAAGPAATPRALERAGLSVRRTDITPAFVELLRSGGHQADQLDPLHDDLADPAAPGTPYDGVWADASLLHVDRDDLPTVLTRLARATRRGGTLFVSVKEGDGEDWSTHGNVTAPRFFTFWRDEPLRSVVEAAGWRSARSCAATGRDGEQWLEVARRPRA